MNRKTIVSLAVIMVLGVAMLTPPAGRAQDMRTLEIRDGIVRIDGKEVPGERLPESLRPGDVDLYYSWTGASDPVIEIGERYFTVESGRLQEVDAIVYRNARQRFFDAQAAAGEDTWYSAGAEDPTTRKQVEALSFQAREMAELSQELSQKRKADYEHLADEIRKQAEITQRIAVEIPRMNVTTYWDAVRESDQTLYNQLVEEWELESRIQALAGRVRGLSVGEDRDALVSELKERLGEAFELKQENRRREIDQLEKELNTLQERLKERESLRRKIIEKRMRELIGDE